MAKINYENNRLIKDEARKKYTTTYVDLSCAFTGCVDEYLTAFCGVR